MLKRNNHIEYTLYLQICYKWLWICGNGIVANEVKDRKRKLWEEGNMAVETKMFGTIEIEEEKIITFEKGLIGLPDLKKFALITDAENTDTRIQWLQSLDEPAMALPIINPYEIIEEYNPIVEDELLKSLGEFKEENLMLMVTIRVPSDIKQMTINLKGPIIINAETKKGCQIIIEDDLPVRYPIYEILEKKKEKAGE